MRALFGADGALTAAALNALLEDDRAGRALMRSDQTVEVVSLLAMRAPGTTFGVREVAADGDMDWPLVYEEIRRLHKARLIERGERRGQWRIAEHPFWRAI